ncbi:MAG: beta-propeller domain-containing protein [Candidatus Marsarchaeota archaeon]|nr:beta-propeller domain-containing protein [Candidatus Marsarchaeota archaeon]
MNKTSILAVFAIGLLLALAGCAQNAGQNKNQTAGPSNFSSTPGSVYVPQGVPQLNVVAVPYNASEFTPSALDLSKPVRAQTFASLDDLQAFAAHYSTSNTYYYRYGGVAYDAVGGVKGATGGAPVPTTAPQSGGGESQPSYSQTNNQVENVDEADLIKTDGNYIYTITDQTLYIVKAYPGENASVVSRITLSGSDSSPQQPIRCLAISRCLPPVFQTGYQPQQLFVLGDKLAVFGSYRNSRFYADTGISPRLGMSFFDIYDISNRQEPKLVKEYRFEGDYFRARMVGDYAYFITRSNLGTRANPLPLSYDGEKALPMAPSDVYYFNIPYQSPVMVNIHAISLANPSEEVGSKSLVVEDSQELYMNENHLYFAYTQTIDPWQIQQDVTLELAPKFVNITAGDRSLIEKINRTDDEVISPAEKRSRIMQIYSDYIALLPTERQNELTDEIKLAVKAKLANYSHREFTVLNEVGVEGSRIVPIASGRVPGHINNQFSLDEQGGVLRIATTLSQLWSWDGSGMEANSSSNVYTLNAADLSQLDGQEGIASGEQIYSTRFMGGRLYLVTYRQVDPFFVYDLSDARNIRELGSLKVPGFSRYLHPYDNNTVIGIGQESNEAGRVKGLKISLFDVSDVANPKEVAKYVSSGPYVQSTALWEHKAFLFSREKSLLAIPAYNYDWQDKSASFNGALVFNISSSGITLRGLIDHSKGLNSDYNYQPAVERSLYIDGELYTKSAHLLRINALGDLHSVQNVTLEPDTAGGIPVY